MNRRQFLGGLLSVPFLGFLKGGESAEAKSSPPREAVGSATRLQGRCFAGDILMRRKANPDIVMVAFVPPRGKMGDYELCGIALHDAAHGDRIQMHVPTAPKGGAS